MHQEQRLASQINYRNSQPQARFTLNINPLTEIPWDQAKSLRHLLDHLPYKEQIARPSKRLAVHPFAKAEEAKALRYKPMGKDGAHYSRVKAQLNTHQDIYNVAKLQLKLKKERSQSAEKQLITDAFKEKLDLKLSAQLELEVFNQQLAVELQEITKCKQQAQQTARIPYKKSLIYSTPDFYLYSLGSPRQKLQKRDRNEEMFKQSGERRRVQLLRRINSLSK